MSEFDPRFAEGPKNLSIDQIHANLRGLERRDWWLWASAVSVTLLLTAAVVSLSVTVLLRERDKFFELNLEQAVRGLVGMVLIFNLYTIYQQVLIKRLRRKLAEEIAVMAGLRMRAEEFHTLATVDPVTGLYNRRFAERRLAAEVNRSRRYSYPLTVLLLRINGFQEVNERHGFSAGDKLLRIFAEQLTKAIRVSDVPVRMSGGEFMVLLPECRPERAQGLLERLEPLDVDFRGKKIPVTLSAGWAGYQSGELPRQLLERAERELSAGTAKKPDHQITPAL